MAKDKKLSDEDRILWGKVIRHTRPLAGRKDDLTLFAEPAPEKPVAAEKDMAAGAMLTGTNATAKPDQLAVPRPRIHQPLEKPVKRKLSKGRLALEARIDLHGLIQGDAHFLLLDFVRRAHGRGLRHVLVITGKGTSLGSDGALKRAVPLWFSLPEFRSMISSYEPAARNHGGDGALYIRLARKPEPSS